MLVPAGEQNHGGKIAPEPQGAAAQKAAIAQTRQQASGQKDGRDGAA